MNCKNCGYKYCPFRGTDREIPAYFCEDFEQAEAVSRISTWVRSHLTECAEENEVEEET